MRKDVGEKTNSDLHLHLEVEESVLMKRKGGESWGVWSASKITAKGFQVGEKTYGELLSLWSSGLTSVTNGRTLRMESNERAGGG
jgi:hypothetical protein